MARPALAPPAGAPPIRFARTAGGTPVAWARSGRGPALVRVAHWLTHVEREAESPIWRPWLDRYDAIGSLIRYDERGYGLSGDDTDAHGLDRCVADLHAVVEASGDPHVRALAPQVRCPTLVLQAQDDRVVPLSIGRELAAAIPGARFATLPTANHVPTPSDPALARLFDALGAFLHEGQGPPVPRLTTREQALARCVADGLDNLQIAARLGIADKTVRNALSALYAKLQVDGRPQAVVRTRELGWGQSRPS